MSNVGEDVFSCISFGEIKSENILAMPTRSMATLKRMAIEMNQYDKFSHDFTKKFRA